MQRLTCNRHNTASEQFEGEEQKGNYSYDAVDTRWREREKHAIAGDTDMTAQTRQGTVGRQTDSDLDKRDDEDAEREEHGTGTDRETDKM